MPSGRLTDAHHTTLFIIHFCFITPILSPCSYQYIYIPIATHNELSVILRNRLRVSAYTYLISRLLIYLLLVLFNLQ